ncbi:MAG: hypothetical protein M0P27_09515, partial [Bacteroidales bacterium]|nr:hypothetical protein [Bacteroidales bacterium]
ALVDSVNGLISEGLNNYITENELNLIGEPLPNEKEQKPVDWDNDTAFDFVFDIASSPVFDLEIGGEDKLPRYIPEISESESSKYLSNLLKQYGKMEDVETAQDDDFIIADLQQGEKRIEKSYISLKTINNQKEKNKFLGKKAGDSLVVDVNEAFENEVDRAALLKLKKEELNGINPEFSVEIKEIKRFMDAQLNQELYGRIFGPDAVKNETEYEDAMKKKMEAEYMQESDYRFMLDARNYLIEKADIRLPEDFLKRWLYSANEGKYTMEEIEKEFHNFLKDFRWQMIKGKIMKEQKLEVTKEKLLDNARKVASYQFAMYGLNNVPAEQIDRYAQSLLENEKEQRRIFEKSEEDQVMDFLLRNVTLAEKRIPLDELQKTNN